MSFGFLNTLMLLGLAAMAIPILIHLLNRRRYNTVDWGAMQFLQVSETTRRRLLIEELLLMLLRMGLIGILVAGLAAPFLSGEVLKKLGASGNRDVVLVVDGSASMSYTGAGKPAEEAAKEWAGQFVNDLQAGDSVAVLQAKQQTVPVLPTLTSDLEKVRDSLDKLPPPAGGSDWAQAVKAAHDVLAKSQRPRRDIILVGDGQRYGWADDTSLLKWELLASGLKQEGTALKPDMWAVNVSPGRPANPPNWSVAPIQSSRAVTSAGQQVTFRTGLVLRGQQEYSPPNALRVEIDGKPVTTDLKAPSSARLDRGQVPLTFHYRFPAAGSHLVSVIVEPDPPAEARPAGYVLKDHLPADNRQDFAVEVLPALPVVIVDGDDRPPAPGRGRGSDFVRDALAPARDLTPAVRAKVITAAEFTPEVLTADVGPEAGSKPRVLVLSNVAKLTAAQQEAVESFLEGGGGVLVTLGNRVDAEHYTGELYRGGQGWLPAKVETVAGDESKPQLAPGPLPSSFFHPALELFREVTFGGLAEARFPRWWKLAIPGRSSAAVPVGLLTSNDPFLVEKAVRNGRVMVAAVPLDKSWRTNLPDLPAFVPLVHELVYYLAGVRGAEYNLQPGQPIRYRTDSQTVADRLTLQPPHGEAKPLRFDGTAGGDSYPAQLVRQAQGSLVVYEGVREPGVYRMAAGDEPPVYYVAQSDSRESDLAPASPEDRDKVAALQPLKYEDDVSALRTAMATATERHDVWWWFLMGVIALLCGEVWMTRRMVKNQ